MTKLSPEAEQALDVAAARYALQQAEGSDLLDKVRAIELAVKRRRAPLSALLGLCVAALVGCAPSVPSFYSVSSEFSPAARETIISAVEAWCEASGDCPQLAMFSEEAHFELVDDLPEEGSVSRHCPEGYECVVNGKEANGLIRIARNRTSTGLDNLWHIAAHEFGHLCIDRHVEESALMAAVEPEEPLLEVDAAAVAAWRAGCP